MEPLTTAALISGGAAVLGGGVNAAQTGRMNRKSMKFALQMYRMTAADNYKNWQLQNEYNSPQAHMKRLQEAGINPHYGLGNGGGSASSIPTPETQTPEFKVPDSGDFISRAGSGIGNSIMSYYDIEIKKAQTDNLKAQNTVILEDAILRRAQARATMTAEERARFDLELVSELRPVSAEMARERLRQTKVETDRSIDENARRAALTTTSLKEAAQRYLNLQEQNLNLQEQRKGMRVDRFRTATDIQRMKKQLDLMDKEGQLKQFDINLRNMGIQPGDPMWTRMVAQALPDLLKPLENLPKEMKTFPGPKN